MSKEEISVEEQPLCSHTINKCPIEFKPSKQEKYKYSEEEKEAIEYWKKWLTLFNLNAQLASEHYLQVLLNLIEKQQKEIEELEEKCKDEFRRGVNVKFADEIKGAKHLIIPELRDEIKEAVSQLKEHCKLHECIDCRFYKSLGNGITKCSLGDTPHKWEEI